MLTFGASAWLWGLGAVAVPIAIHLYHRQRYVRIRWAAMQWLRKAHLKSVRKMKIQHWLLLAVRCLMLALLATAFAGPVVRSAGASAVLGQRNVVVVIDNSLSMGAEEGGRSLVETARERARHLVRSLPAGSRAALIVMPEDEGDAAPVMGGGTSRILERLAGVDTGFGRLDIGRGVDRILDTVETSAVERAEVFWFTDLQALHWEPTDPDVRRKLRDLSLAHRLVLVDVAPHHRPNSAVREVRLRETHARAGVPLTVEVVVHNGGEERPDVPLFLYVDGDPKEERAVTLPAEGESVHAFNVKFDGVGFHEVEVRLEPDALPADDRGFLAVQVHERLPFLLVDGDPGSEPRESEVFYLAGLLRALGAGGDGEPSFEPRVRRVSEILPRDLHDVPVVFLANVRDLPAPFLDALEGFVERGGGVVFFLGDQVDVEHYNATFWRDGEGLLPAPLEEVVGDLDAALDDPRRAERLGPVDRSHPLVAPIGGRGSDQEGFISLLRTPVLRHVRVGVDPERKPAARVLMECVPSGDPAVIERPFGEGRVVLVTTTADGAWTTWQAHPSWMVFVDRLVAVLGEAYRSGLSGRLGEPIRMPIPPEGAEAAVWVTPAPDEERISADIEPSDRGPEAVLAGTVVPGFYRLHAGDEVRAIGVNLDGAESDLARTDVDRMRERIEGIAIEVQREGALGEDAERAIEIRKPMLGALLVLLGIEGFLAWRFGVRDRRVEAT